MTRSRNETQRKLEEKTSAEARIEEEKRAAKLELDRVKQDMTDMKRERLTEQENFKRLTVELNEYKNKRKIGGDVYDQHSHDQLKEIVQDLESKNSLLER